MHAQNRIPFSSPRGQQNPSRSTRLSQNTFSNTPQRAAMVILRGDSNKRNTFGANGFSDSERRNAREASNVARDNSSGSNRYYKLSDTTLNKTS